jgi:hypothetical protein
MSPAPLADGAPLSHRDDPPVAASSQDPSPAVGPEYHPEYQRGRRSGGRGGQGRRRGVKR